MVFGQNTSDNLNPADNTVPILKKTDEITRLEEDSTLIFEETIGNSWIVGSATNGIVGTNTGTQGGGQQVVGGDGRILTLSKVINQNNLFRENFRVTNFQGAGTANWDTTNHRLASSTSSNHSIIHSTHQEFNTMFLNGQTITKATINATETRWNPNDKIAYFLSADGGNNWEEVTLGVEHIFTNTGDNLKAKVVFFTSGGIDTYIKRFRTSYEATA